jgi:hypothetical protein
MLSAQRILWRNKYSLQSIIIAPIAMNIGIIVFAHYLMYLLLKENGDIKNLLIGDRI